ncbi:MAG: hypothetical protein IJL26_06640 [Clostridia bacterium]|nr:hypothetical protein [Clostridia bacterium]
MKKTIAILCAAAFFLALTVFSVSVSAQESVSVPDLSDVSNMIDGAVQNSPEVSSLVDQLNQGVDISSDRLLEALRGIEGLDVDRLLQGLNGLDEDDGLLGKLSALLGPNSNGLSGLLSQLGESFSGLGGSLDLGGSVLGGLLNGLGDLTGLANPTSTTQAPTVHTTASAYTQPASSYTPQVTPSTYTYSYSTSVSTYTPPVSYPSASVNYNQYTVPYTPATTVPAISGAVTDPAATTVFSPEATATVPASEYIAVPVSEIPAAQAEAKKQNGWKKAVGAVLVLGAFAGIAAVVVKKSM